MCYCAMKLNLQRLSIVLNYCLRYCSFGNTDGDNTPVLSAALLRSGVVKRRKIHQSPALFNSKVWLQENMDKLETNPNSTRLKVLGVLYKT